MFSHKIKQTLNANILSVEHPAIKLQLPNAINSKQICHRFKVFETMQRCRRLYGAIRRIPSSFFKGTRHNLCLSRKFAYILFLDRIHSVFFFLTSTQHKLYYGSQKYFL